MTEESPPCVIYPKGGKGNAQRNLERHGLATREKRFGSRLRKGKVLAPLTSVVLDGIHALRKEKVAKTSHTHTEDNTGGVKRKRAR